MTDPGTGAVTNWNVTTINGKRFLVVDVAAFRIPLDWDPDSKMLIAIAAPSGGVGNLPVLLKGDQGDMPNLDLTVALNALEPGDPTPDSAQWLQLNPTTFKLSLSIHKGAKGDDGEMFILSAGDVDQTLRASGKILVVNPANNGLVYQTQKVGDRYLPGALVSMPAGYSAYTIAPLTIPPLPWDYRVDPCGFTVVTPNGGRGDLLADLICRLGNTNSDNGETSGNDIGIGICASAITAPTLLKIDGIPPMGSNDAWDRVASGAAHNVYFRVERRAGLDSPTTSTATTRVGVKIRPL